MSVTKDIIENSDKRIMKNLLSDNHIANEHIDECMTMRR